jgi:hypothetical protein
MQQPYLDSLVEDDYPALAGVTRKLFEQIFVRYCPGTAIRQRWQLFRVLFFLKTNPTWQAMRVETRAKDKRTIRRSILRHTRILAERMQHDVDRVWASRRDLGQPPDYARRLFNDVTFLVDTFPIVITRSKRKQWRRATYSGKYKQFVLKAQMICSFTGIPLRVTGPHAGVRADIDIFRQHKPPIDANELGLGDKAYYGDDDVEPPFKKPKGGELTEEQEDYNVVHSWLRATVEHAIWQMKKFQILGGLYRGKVWRNSSNLSHCLTIVTRIIQLQTMQSPLRHHVDMDGADDGRGEAKVPAAPEVIDGMIIGRVIDIRGIDGHVRGPIMNDDDVDPGDDSINSGFSFNQFVVGDRVLAYWWGRWWRGRVKGTAARNRTLTIRFDWSNKTVSKYKPRCVYKLDP